MFLNKENAKIDMLYRKGFSMTVRVVVGLTVTLIAVSLVVAVLTGQTSGFKTFGLDAVKNGLGGG